MMQIQNDTSHLNDQIEKIRTGNTTSVHLSKVASKDIDAILNALTENKTVTELTLMKCNLNLDHIRLIAKIPALTSLALTQCKGCMGKGAIGLIADMHNLHILKFKDCAVDNDCGHHAYEIARILENNTLSRLHMHGNPMMNDDCAEIIADALKYNTCLEVLDIEDDFSNGRCMYDGVSALSEAIQGNSSIIGLELGSCGYDVGGSTNKEFFHEAFDEIKDVLVTNIKIHSYTLGRYIRNAFPNTQYRDDNILNIISEYLLEKDECYRRHPRWRWHLLSSKDLKIGLLTDKKLQLRDEWKTTICIGKNRSLFYRAVDTNTNSNFIPEVNIEFTGYVSVPEESEQKQLKQAIKESIDSFWQHNTENRNNMGIENKVADKEGTKEKKQNDNSDTESKSQDRKGTKRNNTQVFQAVLQINNNKKIKLETDNNMNIQTNSNANNRQFNTTNSLDRIQQILQNNTQMSDSDKLLAISNCLNTSL
ncbi:MAG: hypothetical protein COB50_01845 [Thiotrichales bacterium]|nr:MAG: hypothetical protein COB50_01845 [Thiotrichales bacterium]